jgi:hypothetical protein
VARSPEKDDGGTSKVRLRNDAKLGEDLHVNAPIAGAGDRLCIPGPALAAAKLVGSCTDSLKLRRLVASGNSFA